MKRKPLHTHRTRRQQPPLIAWLLLISAWAIVLPFALQVGHAIHKDRSEKPETPQAAEAFAPAHIAEPVTVNALSAETARIPALRSLRGESPTILIYHTHTTEAYTQTAQNPYKASGEWRTTDNTKNVVAVGEALKTILETEYGFSVLHDTTDHEPPKLSTAYDRSLVTMQRYKEQYPSIVLYLDLHRDAYSAAEAPTDYLTINGTETARLMFVVGRGEKYEEKPYFDSDYALASRITAHLCAIDEKLARPIRVKTGRYNQHVAPNCLLVEVGHNANTLEQALAAMPYLAESIAFAYASFPQSDGLFVPN